MAPQNTPTPPRATRRARPGASPCPTKLRPFAIAGAVLLGAGFVVSAPPSVGYLPVPATVRDVALIAGDSDLLTPWIDQYNAASQNATQLLNAFFDAPNVGLQQLIANQVGYLQAFLNDPTSSTVTAISQQMQANLAAVLTGLPLQNATKDTTNTVLAHTLDVEHRFLFSEAPNFLPPNVNPAEVAPILNFLGSPVSGIIMGELGPFIAPWVALGNSISAGDDLNETLANMVGAYFNGADLNLDSLVPAINSADVFPSGMYMTNLDFAFGGLLSSGDVVDGVGGSIFNSIGLHLTGVPQIDQVTLTSHPIGPLGAWEGMVQTIASLLGWDGSGSPLSDVTLPIIPTDLLDGGAAAADASTWLQDLLAAF